MAQISPTFEPGDRVTAIPDVAVTGGRFVAVSGINADEQIKVALPAAAKDVFGVAAQDALAGVEVTILRGKSLLIAVEAGAAVTNKDLLKVDAQGRVVPQAGAGTVVGTAIGDAASGERVLVDRQLLTAQA